MKDAIYGDLGTVSPTTKATDYPAADYVDTGPINSKSRFTKHTEAEELYACFAVETQDLASADSLIPYVEEADDSGFSTNDGKLLTGEQSAGGVVQGLFARIPIRGVAHRRYIRLGVSAESTGTFTSGPTVHMWFELGERAPAL